MADHISPERRSWLMSRVKGKNTTPEIRVRRLAHATGLRFRLHRRDLPGKPDIIFPRYKVALFVHGCFWHRHPGCKKASSPKTRQEFWTQKFEKNIARDQRNVRDLENAGWSTLVVWECETKSEDRLRELFKEIKDQRIQKQANIDKVL